VVAQRWTMISTGVFYRLSIPGTEADPNLREGNHKRKECARRYVYNVMRQGTTRTHAGTRGLTLMQTTKAMLSQWKTCSEALHEHVFALMQWQ